MKFLRVLGNILWFICCGLEMFLSEIFGFILSIVLIIPIFIGIPKVKLTNAAFVAFPFGKKVETHFGKAPIRNILSFIFGGFISALFAFLLGIILCITIIGIPVGKVMFGIAKLEFAPFKAEIVNK